MYYDRAFSGLRGVLPLFTYHEKRIDVRMVFVLYPVILSNIVGAFPVSQFDTAGHLGTKGKEIGNRLLISASLGYAIVNFSLF